MFTSHFASSVTPARGGCLALHCFPASAIQHKALLQIISGQVTYIMLLIRPRATLNRWKLWNRIINRFRGRIRSSINWSDACISITRASRMCLSERTANYFSAARYGTGKQFRHGFASFTGSTIKSKSNIITF